MAEPTEARSPAPLDLPIYHAPLPGFAARRSDVLAAVTNAIDESGAVAHSSVGGRRSAANLHQHSDPSLVWLVETAVKMTEIGLRAAGHLDHATHLEPAACWAVVNARGDWHLPHRHGELEWAVVCHLEIPEAADPSVPTGGDLLFIDTTAPDRGQQITRSVAPQPGEAVFFPGWVTHMVAPNNCDAPRIAAAMNLRVAEAR